MSTFEIACTVEEWRETVKLSALVFKRMTGIQPATAMRKSPYSLGDDIHGDGSNPFHESADSGIKTQVWEDWSYASGQKYVTGLTTYSHGSDISATRGLGMNIFANFAPVPWDVARALGAKRPRDFWHITWLHITHVSGGDTVEIFAEATPESYITLYPDTVLERHKRYKGLVYAQLTTMALLLQDWQ